MRRTRSRRGSNRVPASTSDDPATNASGTGAGASTPTANGSTSAGVGVDDRGSNLPRLGISEDASHRRAKLPPTDSTMTSASSAGTASTPLSRDSGARALSWSAAAAAITSTPPRKPPTSGGRASIDSNASDASASGGRSTTTARGRGNSRASASSDGSGSASKRSGASSDSGDEASSPDGKREQSRPHLRINVDKIASAVSLATKMLHRVQTPVTVRAKSAAPLRSAVVAGLSSVKQLLQQVGPAACRHQAGLKDEYGYTPMMTACALSHQESAAAIVDVLISECGFMQFDATDKDGFTCLHWAAACGGAPVVTRLLREKPGPRIDARSVTGDTPLMRAARLGRTGCVKLLVQAGADVRAMNKAKHTALDVAGIYKERRSPTLRKAVRKMLLDLVPSLRTLVLHHDDCLEHGGESHQESAERIRMIRQHLMDPTRIPPYEICLRSDFDLATRKAVTRVHTEKYYSLVKSLEEQVKIVPGSYVPFTPVIQRALRNDPPSQWKSEDACDTSFTLGSMRAALRAAGAVCTAVDSVMSDDARHAFCVVRPPGHHAGVEGLMADAEKDSSCGFCIFNSVAIGALHAIETKGARVAIVDWDVHHGNGTEEIVRAYHEKHADSTARDNLFFFSVHLFDVERSHARDTPTVDEQDSKAEEPRQSTRTTRSRSKRLGHGGDTAKSNGSTASAPVKVTRRSARTTRGKKRIRDLGAAEEGNGNDDDDDDDENGSDDGDAQAGEDGGAGDTGGVGGGADGGAPLLSPLRTRSGRRRRLAPKNKKPRTQAVQEEEPRSASAPPTSSAMPAGAFDTTDIDRSAVSGAQQAATQPLRPPMSPTGRLMPAKLSPTVLSPRVAALRGRRKAPMTPLSRVTHLSMQLPGNVAGASAAGTVPPPPIFSAVADTTAPPTAGSSGAAALLIGSPGGAVGGRPAINIPQAKPFSAPFLKSPPGSPRQGTTNRYQFYPGSGRSDNLDANCVNCPVVPLWRERRVGGKRQRNSNSGREAFRTNVKNRLIPALRAFNPDLILISAGFDAGHKDLGNARFDGVWKHGTNLKPDDFKWMTERVKDVAKRCCPGRVVSVLEGGYGVWRWEKVSSTPKVMKLKVKLDNLAENSMAHLHGLLGDTC